MTDIKSGVYRDWAGEEQWCVVRDKDVYCTGKHSFTCASHQTFKDWGWEYLRSDFRAPDEPQHQGIGR